MADARASRGAVGCQCHRPQAAERARHAASQPGRAVSPLDDPRERSATPGGPDRGAGCTGRPLPCRPPTWPGLPADRRRPAGVSACGDVQSHAAVRKAVMAAVRLSRRQKQIVRWWAADAKRTRGMSTRSHPELVAALPSAKGHVSHRLRRLATQGRDPDDSPPWWENRKRLSDCSRSSAGPPTYGKVCLRRKNTEKPRVVYKQSVAQ